MALDSPGVVRGEIADKMGYRACLGGELIFTDVLWPDFRRQHLWDAIEEFQQRERRFGAV